MAPAGRLEEGSRQRFEGLPEPPRLLLVTAAAEQTGDPVVLWRAARQLGVEEPFPGAQNVLPWLDEQANLRKEKNFFETRVTEYQTGGLHW